MVPTKDLLKTLAVPVLIMAAISVQSSIPTDGGAGNIQVITNLNPVTQNVGHIPVYGLLVFFWLKFFNVARFPVHQMVCFSLLLTIAFGCFDEIHQGFVRGRDSDFYDILLNTAGAVLGTVFFMGPGRRFLKR